MSVSHDVVATLRAQDHGHPPLVFDARGNGGALCPTITGDHQNRITDYTAIVVHTPQRATDSTPKDLELSAQAAGTTGGGSEIIVLESNQNHATAKDTEVCTTLPASMGMGGGYVPMIVDALVFDKAQITSKLNYSRPTWGGHLSPSHKRGGGGNRDN